MVYRCSVARTFLSRLLIVAGFLWRVFLGSRANVCLDGTFCVATVRTDASSPSIEMEVKIRQQHSLHVSILFLIIYVCILKI